MPWWVVIGFLILLILGAFLTLYFLKPTEGFQVVGDPVPQIFLISFKGDAPMSHDQAISACAIMGGRLALATEVYNAAVAAKIPLDWKSSPRGTGPLARTLPTPGWIADDTKYGYYPIGSTVTVEDITGPAIVRAGYELDVNCDGSSLYFGLPNAAICYGILPASNNTYNIYPSGGDDLVARRAMLDSSNLSSVFDKADTYTILDLDALNVQKSIMIIDLENRNKDVYNSEKTILTGITDNSLDNLISIPDLNKKRIYTGYAIAKSHTDLLKNLSDAFLPLNFATDPYFPILQASKILGSAMSIDTFKNILLNNINMYYSDIIKKLNIHPVAYMASGILNSPVYLNAFGITTSKKWEYIVKDNKILKQTIPPYPGCGTVNYNKIDPNVPMTTAFNHCPSGRWWQDKKTAGLNKPGDVILTAITGGIYNLASACPPNYTKYDWDAYDCIQEWPQLQQTITNRDLNLFKQTMVSQSPQSYPTNFLSASDGWIPTAAADSNAGNIVLNKFIADKRQLATSNNITSMIEKTYRWKPIKYLGTLSEINKAEAKQSALISALFNFTDTTTIENQIRIASTPPFDLYYSKLARAKPEFVQVIAEGSRTPASNAELLTALTILGIATSVIAGSVGAVATFRGASATSRISRGATTASIAGAAISIGAGAAMAVSQGRATSTNFTIAASNADYNSSICSKLTVDDFNLLPYHTREFITVWAMMRKQRMIEWFANSVYTQGSGNRNPPEGPYKGSPNAAATAAAWGAGGLGHGATDTGGVTIHDISANILGSGVYRLSETPTINSITGQTADSIRIQRNKIYDSMAQLYYNINNGAAYITKILDVYQVGTTLYDVRFTESRRSGSPKFISKITALNEQYRQYRLMKLSESQLNNLESTYSSTIEKLYKDENSNLADSATNCGVNARSIKITRTGSQPFNMSQIIVLNNFGQNVALSRKVTATSIYFAPYEDKTGQIYYDSNYQPYDISSCKLMAAADNSGAALQILSGLTDGIYTTRYDSFYRSKPSDTTAEVAFNFGDNYDIGVVTVLYDSTITGGTFKVELFSSSASDPPVQRTFTCDSTGKSTVSFLRDRPVDEASCPTSIYSQYKTARFFASSATITPPIVSAHNGTTYVTPLTFTAYSPDGATTFNPLYNAGFAVDITNPSGSINYVPATVFNIVPATTLPDCSDTERIKTIFKDHYLSLNNSKFKNRPDIAALINTYDSQFLYKPAVVTAVGNATTNKYNCAYIWKENLYSAADGSIIPGSQVERYGIFNYKYDTENWVSRGVVFDLSDSLQFSVASAIPVTMTPLPTPISLYIPYYDSQTLDNKAGQIPETDCSDPAVINSIITAYNNYTGTNKILRVTKALTVAKNKCEYEYTTANSLKSRIQIQVRADQNKDGTWSYVPSNLTDSTGNTIVNVAPSVYIDDSTPLLARAYNYASDSVKPFVNTMTSVFTDLKSYLDPQTDETGSGIKGDLITYRKTTNTAAGIIRNVSVIGEPVVNELGVKCTTQCNSPEIIQSFFSYYNNTGGDKVTRIQNVGMDASGNCDFTYQAAPVIMGTTPSLGQGMTRAAKFRISRYLNSCAYTVTGAPAVILPTPNITSILNFQSPSVFGPSGSASGVINTAQLGITGPSGPILAPGSPYVQTTNIIENIDYVNCFSKYTLNSISNTGVTGSVTGIKQVDAKTCAITINGVQNQYSFVPQPSVIASTLVPTKGPVSSMPVTVITPTPITNYALPPPTSLNCSDQATTVLTGLASIVSSRAVGADSCEYKITTNNTLPFANTFQRASFYSDNGLHLKSIGSSNPVTSPYAYFQTANIRSTFIDDYINLLQLMRYTWNAQFYSIRPTSTRYWKMGNITNIGILAEDDAVVFEAESAIFGSYGEFDVRGYSPKRYFKITPRINTDSGVADSPYTINNIGIYKSEDSADSFGTYRVAAVPTAAQYTQICTYNGKNYSGPWYDSYGTGLPPQDAPPATYVVQNVNTPLMYGIYNMVRFTVKAAGAEGRAELARIMFYDTSGSTYVYQRVPNASVEIQDISSNYLLVERGKNSCDKNYRSIVDPETTLVECIYVGNGSRSYTQSTPCNTGDITESSASGSYNCLSVTQTTYTKPADVACGIGYFGTTAGTTCTLTGDFQTVTQDPSYMFNLNQAVPRLRLAINKAMTINFNKRVHIAGFSFITGSAGTVPYQWTLEGSVNGITWATIHCQTTNYQYVGARVPAGSTTPVLSFFTPGIFTTSVLNVCGDSTTTGPFTSVGGYSANNLPVYKNMAGNIAEGFKGGILRTKYAPQKFKLRILETYDPNSKFVHMSSLEFYTKSGRVKSPQLSNLQGSRNSPKEGVTALLEGRERRWVDYNKSDINIRIEGEPPITGFRFSIPDVPNAMAAMPIHWIMYDGSNKIVHEFEGTSLPLINNFATIVFKFAGPSNSRDLANLIL